MLSAQRFKCSQPLSILKCPPCAGVLWVDHWQCSIARRAHTVHAGNLYGGRNSMQCAHHVGTMQGHGWGCMLHLPSRSFRSFCSHQLLRDTTATVPLWRGHAGCTAAAAAHVHACVGCHAATDGVHFALSVLTASFCLCDSNDNLWGRAEGPHRNRNMAEGSISVYVDIMIISGLMSCFYFLVRCLKKGSRTVILYSSSRVPVIRD